MKTHILGIDIAKNKIDVALSQNKPNAPMVINQFTNHLTGYKRMLTWLKKEGVDLEDLLTCMENTGIYHRSLADFLQSQNVFCWVENPFTIKWSRGLERGKTDELDAKRICLYAFRNQDRAQGYTAKDQTLQKVSELLAARERIVKARNMLLVPIRELQEVGLQEEARLVKKVCKTSISALEREIKMVDKELKDLVKKEEPLQASYQYVRSVNHVGDLTALRLLVQTHDFERFDNVKKLSCYAGVAPFAYESGSSIKGRTRVHSMANKPLKKALHMCALSSISRGGEMRVYFDRKVKEGKNKMSVLNAIRNKILHRIYACVKARRNYVPFQAA